MKNVNTLIFFILLISSSCSGLSEAKSSLIPLEKRKYDICQDLKGFCWNYYSCSKRFLGICIRQDLYTDRIEFTFKDQEEVKKLYQMNFIKKKKKKPL